MTPRIRLVLIWFAASVLAIVAAFVALSVMVDETTISYATELPRSAVTVPMIAVVVFWGIVRACGVRLAPMRTFVLGGLAVYALLYLVGRVLAVTGLSPLLVLVVNLAALMGLAWVAVISADDGRQ